MLSTIGHRGPDRFGGFVNGPIALGSARLSIVDLEGGAQPAVSIDRRVCVVFNGEIFNYVELRKELQRSGVAFQTRSEVETLLHLYLKYGEGMVAKLDGQFAIAVWDGRGDEKLLLARDRMGIRPLFWHRDGKQLSFASEIKALFALRDVTARLDRRSIIQTFRFWTNIGETTAFENVSQLPAGHFLVIDKNGEHLVRYWDWPYQEVENPILLESDDAYFELFREKLNDAIARQRMADVPVGSYLSGGIDSAVIAALLHEQKQGENLTTFSITFDDPEYDERAAQTVVANHFGFKHSTVNVRSADIGAAFPQVVWHAETPLFRTAPVPLFLLSRKVHDCGMKVVMTGEGADEVLLGYDLFREIRIRHFWGRNPDSAWRGQLFKRLYAYLPQYRNPRYFNMLLDFYRPFLANTGDPHFSMAVRWANGEALEGYFSENMREFSTGNNPVAQLEPWLSEAYGQADDIARAQNVEASTLLGNYLLSSQGDRMSMAHAVEGRYPYLDHHFVEFAARLPRSVKLRGLRDKFVLRNALADQLPKEIKMRPKVAYQAPDLKGFFENGKAPDYVEELLSPNRVRDVGLFDPDRVSMLMKKARTFDLARVGTRDNMAFVLMLSTHLLDELFVRQSSSMSAKVPIPATMNLV